MGDSFQRRVVTKILAAGLSDWARERRGGRTETGEHAAEDGEGGGGLLVEALKGYGRETL